MPQRGRGPAAIPLRREETVKAKPWQTLRRSAWRPGSTVSSLAAVRPRILATAPGLAIASSGHDTARLYPWDRRDRDAATIGAHALGRGLARVSPRDALGGFG